MSHSVTIRTELCLLNILSHMPSTPALIKQLNYNNASLVGLSSFQPTFIPSDSNNKAVQPFLRWAGGKRWLAKELEKYLPVGQFNQYHEPFLGGGSIFFHLHPKKSFLSDTNQDLINTYKMVRDESEQVADLLKTFKNTSDDYYEIRSIVFDTSVERAAQFIYLNSTSFNGIYRVNLDGKYNTPYGKRTGYKFDYDNFYKVATVLQNVTFNSCDFLDALANIQKNDLVFLDPPYTVTHNNNSFIQYNQKLFSISEQYKLSEMINKIKKIGAYYILTNAAHPRILEIFDHGDPVFEVRRNSTVGGLGAKRGKYREVIMTNGV